MGKSEELKLPKYVAGLPYSDFRIKYLAAASTRGKTKQALLGKYMGILPKPTDVSGTLFRDLSTWELAVEAENDRAFNELLSCMPYGKLTSLVADSITDEYPNGCAGSAWIKVLNEIGKHSADDRRRLKEMFETEHELNNKKNPAKYIDKLVEIQKELETKYEYITKIN